MKKMTDQRQLALLSGTSLAIMAVTAGIIMSMVFAPVFEMTVARFAGQYAKLKTPVLWGTLGWIVILICDLLVAWGLYRFYHSKNKRVSLIMGSLRLVYSLILLIAIIQLAAASTASNDGASAYHFILGFRDTWQFGLIIFGVHLLYLAPLVFEKRTISRVISIALFFAGAGYVLSNTLDLFLPDYERLRPDVEAVFVLPMILGELGLAIWLLVRGGKEASLKKRSASGSC